MRIAVIAHGHPALSAGGGERAAYSLFEHLKTVDGVEPVFVARAEPRDIGHDGWFGAFRGIQDELLWAPPPLNYFRCVSDDHDLLRLQVAALMERLRPDVVHFHHYHFFGLDALTLCQELGRCHAVLTLHEYMLICRHNGQMVKTGSLRLCDHASPSECHACFPDTPAGQFFLREQLIKDFLGRLDAFVSPSRFLRDRYASWGVDGSRIRVIENLLPRSLEDRAPNPTRARPRSGPIRFGFFGQITPYKGAEVLLAAIEHLSERVRSRVEVVLFGANLEHQTAEFQQALRARIAASSVKVSFFGPYRNGDVPRLLTSVDWMVIPSIWWENSPLVIQEARSAGTPILASDIGGMAEKVTDGVDGLHFLAGSSLELAAKMSAIVDGQVTIGPPRVDLAAQNRSALADHLNLYRELRASTLRVNTSTTSQVG